MKYYFSIYNNTSQCPSCTSEDNKEPDIPTVTSRQELNESSL